MSDVQGLQLEHRELASNAAVRSATEERPPVWSYWEGARPDWLELCQATVRRHHPNVVILNRRSFAELHRESDRPLPPLNQLRPCQRADYVRVFVLAMYGGIWIDADSIVFKPLDPLWRLTELFDFVGYGLINGGYRWYNDFMMSRKGGILVSEYLDKATATILAGPLRNRTAIGPPLLTSLARKPTLRSVPILRLSGALVRPIMLGGSGRRRYDVTGSDSEHADNFSEHAFIYLLTSLILRSVRRASCEEILASPTFLGYLFRQSRVAASEPLEQREPK